MKKVSRIFSAVLAVTLAAATLMTGCKKNEETPSAKRYDYDLTQYITLGQYKGVEVEPFAYEITEEVVQQQIQLALTNYAQVEKKTGAVESGDQVNIDFTGYMDGKAFEGGSATAYTLSVGSGSFIPGFEEGLIGAKEGDTVTLDIAFPTPYSVNPDLAGKPVRFEVKINSVYGQTLPEYTDTFVKEYYGYATTAEFEAALRASIQEQYDSNKWYYILDQVWKQVMETTEVISYPEKEYNEIYNTYLEPYTTAAANANMTLAQFLELSEDMTESEFYAELEAMVKDAVKEELAGHQICRLENITLSDAEYEELAAAFAAERGFDTVEALLEYNQASAEDLRQTLAFQKLFDFLVDNAVVKTANP